LLDGLISTVAALLACRLNPAARHALIAGHLTSEPAGTKILDALRLPALIHAGMRLGEGTGAVAALPLLDMAYAVYRDMPTLESLAIRSYKPPSA
jgi:nicotinate-nucleotide--dimethylbenzimidazole phosphoribosyltransferase